MGNYVRFGEVFWWGRRVATNVYSETQKELTKHVWIYVRGSNIHVRICVWMLTIHVWICVWDAETLFEIC